MNRYFNTEGSCRPKEHYMVNLGSRLQEIRTYYINRGKYFVINRGRQYGKTTTLQLLANDLKPDYLVIAMDFQEIGSADFQDEASFSIVFAKIFLRACQQMRPNDYETLARPVSDFLLEKERHTLQELFTRLSVVCKDSPQPAVLIIDEVDNAGNHQVFLDFLALLRTYYLDRENKPTFQSVVLAGVYDIKNLKRKIRPDSEHQYNSPWNIAADFDIPMGFTAKQIQDMLLEYEADSRTGMDTAAVAEEIWQYTSGYPYLVSALCKLLDEKIARTTDPKHAWTAHGIAEAVKLLLSKSRPLFESMIKQLTEYPEMKHMLHLILFEGKQVNYNPYHPIVNLASMFGYIINKNNSIQITNRIFELCLYRLFLSEEELSNAIYNEAQGNRNQFTEGGRLNMDLVLERFAVCFHDIYGDNSEPFVEQYGRKFFLLFLTPIINGSGNYYIEAQTRDARRTDVIVDYLGERFVVEMKIWHGNEYHERGEAQLAGYLSYYHLTKGYLVSFNFNKNKQTGVRKIQIHGKEITEATI
ncbi:MAG: AAA-like domain-containing protein [Eubacterium sp.]|nr:AAA-like domain-containing protein [Eubacterium sp.]